MLQISVEINIEMLTMVYFKLYYLQISRHLLIIRLLSTITLVTLLYTLSEKITILRLSIQLLNA